MGRIHGVPIHDDDWATAGTALAAADFIAGESAVITRNFGKGADAGVLMDIKMMVADTVAASTGNKSRIELQPTDWTTPERIVHNADRAALVMTDSGAATNGMNTTGNPLVVGQKWARHPKSKLHVGLSWVNSNASKIFATTANEDASAVLYIYYPTGNGVNPVIDKSTGLPYVDIQIPAKAADGDNSAADVFEEYISEVLNDESPGIYTTHQYAIVMLGSEPEGAADDIGTLVRCAPKGQENAWLVACGHGAQLEPCKTYFTIGCPVMSGLDTIVVEGVQTAVHTPKVYVGLQDLTKRKVSVPGSGGSGPRNLGGNIEKTFTDPIMSVFGK